MIHYILLPAQERHALRREYRMRLAIVAFLFISCALVLGIISLLPAYMYSHNLEQEALIKREALMKSRRDSGAEQIEKELLSSQVIAEKILADESKASYNILIQSILSHRKKDILLSTIKLSTTQSTTTVADATLSGRALTREALLGFKKSLDEDEALTNVELPLSDLAKSRNIDFTIKFTIKKQ